MNCFLVLLCRTMSDVPIAVFSDKAEAVDIAAKLNGTVDDSRKVLFGNDESDVVCTKVVSFVGGVPDAVETVKDFTR